MSQPILLDLFCGAGGCSVGYHRAGFRVVGVDSRPQKRYPFEFVQGDALWMLEVLIGRGSICGDGFRYWLRDIAAIHASPPCQAFSSLAALHKHRPEYGQKHPDLIEPTRALLLEAGLPYVIENVPAAPLRDAILLCGTMFGLRTDCGAELRRHRRFETNWFCMAPPRCTHDRTQRSIGVYGHGAPMEGARTISVIGSNPEGKRTISVHGDSPRAGNEKRRRTISVTGATPHHVLLRRQERVTFSVAQARVAMGIEWMTQAELSQAIPPAYTEHIGRQLRLDL